MKIWIKGSHLAGLGCHELSNYQPELFDEK